MSYADRVKKAKEERKGFKFPEGVYNVRFQEGKFGKSKNGDDMFTLIFKVASIESLVSADVDKADIMDMIREKSKKIEVKCLTRLSFQLDHVLEFLSDAGCDLSDCDEKDKKFTGVRALLEELEELQPKAKVHVKVNENDDRYRNYSVRDVQKVVEGSEGAEDSDKSEDSEYTYEDLIDAGWSEKQIAKKYPNLVK